MTTFRKKPVEIQAFQYLGFWPITDAPAWLSDAIEKGVVALHPADFGIAPDTLQISTLEGRMRCPVGSFIIQGVKGELYACDPEIFDATYDDVDAGPYGEHNSQYPGAMHPNAKAPEDYVARFNALQQGDYDAARAAKALREGEALEGELVDDNLPATKAQSFDPLSMHPAEMDPKGFLADDMASVMTAIAGGATDEELDKLELPSHYRQDNATAKAGLFAADEHIQQRSGNAKHLMINHAIKCPTCAANAAALEETRMQMGGLRVQARDATKVAARTQAEILVLADQTAKLQLRHMSPDQGELAELREANQEQADRIIELQEKLRLTEIAKEAINQRPHPYRWFGKVIEIEERVGFGRKQTRKVVQGYFDQVQVGDRVFVEVDPA